MMGGAPAAIWDHDIDSKTEEASSKAENMERG